MYQTSQNFCDIEHQAKLKEEKLIQDRAAQWYFLEDSPLYMKLENKQYAY